VESERRVRAVVRAGAGKMARISNLARRAPGGQSTVQCQTQK